VVKESFLKPVIEPEKPVSGISVLLRLTILVIMNQQPTSTIDEQVQESSSTGVGFKIQQSIWPKTHQSPESPPRKTQQQPESLQPPKTS
jgi:hypothetical protein